jgi:hypothetical protein
MQWRVEEGGECRPSSNSVVAPGLQRPGHVHRLTHLKVQAAEADLFTRPARPPQCWARHNGGLQKTKGKRIHVQTSKQDYESLKESGAALLVELLSAGMRNAGSSRARRRTRPRRGGTPPWRALRGR